MVCNEYGGLEGLVTFKDILEALIGNLPDEHEDPEIIEREDGTYLIDGQCSFYDFLSYFDKEYLYPQYDYNTISGLVLDLLDHVPQSGEKAQWNNFTIEVVDMDGARIDKLLVTDLSEVEDKQ